MHIDDVVAPQTVSVIRDALSRWRGLNEHHVFERLCLDFARARLHPDFVLPTGP
ncbi:hypothetical protein [Kibdelosporangium philippinense]|uniref:hypothetical protein n=1 Tax=Kibdelosporangium philippinense TaxID=211113 RepID=UPI003611B15C